MVQYFCGHSYQLFLKRSDIVSEKSIGKYPRRNDAICAMLNYIARNWGAQEFTFDNSVCVVRFTTFYDKQKGSFIVEPNLRWFLRRIGAKDALCEYNDSIELMRNCFERTSQSMQMSRLLKSKKHRFSRLPLALHIESLKNGKGTCGICFVPRYIYRLRWHMLALIVFLDSLKMAQLKNAYEMILLKRPMPWQTRVQMMQSIFKQTNLNVKSLSKFYNAPKLMRWIEKCAKGVNLQTHYFYERSFLLLD